MRTRCAAGAMLIAIFVVAVHGQRSLFRPISVTGVRCGRLIDVRNGAVTTNAVIGIAQSADRPVASARIVSISPNAALPEGGLDLATLTCLPGLIDVHTHLVHRYRRDLFGTGVEIIAETVQTNPARRAVIGVRMGLEMMEAGITTVRDLGNSGVNIAVALNNAILSGDVPGPRMVVSTRALSSTGGQFPPLQPYAQHLVAQEYVEVYGSDHARRTVREAIANGAEVIKIIIAGPAPLSLDELHAIVSEAHRANRRVAAHAFGEAGMVPAIEAGVDSIEHGGVNMPESALRAMAKKGIYLVPTGSSADEEVPPDFDKLSPDEQRAAREKAFADFRNSRYVAGIRLAMQVGVRIAMGADIYGETQPPATRGTASLATLYGYADAGMSPLQAIQTATINAAELLGWPDRVGSVEVGKFADIIAVDGDPLKDIRAIKDVRVVLKGGDVIRNDSAQ